MEMEKFTAGWLEYTGKAWRTVATEPVVKQLPSTPQPYLLTVCLTDY